MKRRNLITEQNNHIFICGMTRSGKTFFATKALSEVKQGVLFFNLQNTKMPRIFLKTAANKVGSDQLINALRAGNKIDLRFPAGWSMADIMAVMEHLTNKLLKSGFTENDYIYIAYDECQTLDGGAKIAARMAATRGLFLGCRCVFISQRPALADLTFYTQAAEHYIFQLGKGERQYFVGKGIDYDRCLELWQQYGKYSYVYSDGFTLEGRRSA